jgi:predicted HTH domain antitoxin
VLIELACRLFDTERLDQFSAARLAGLPRSEFEAELRSRKIAIYRPGAEDVQEDAAALRKLGG